MEENKMLCKTPFRATVYNYKSQFRKIKILEKGCSGGISL